MSSFILIILPSIRGFLSSNFVDLRDFINLQPPDVMEIHLEESTYTANRIQFCHETLTLLGGFTLAKLNMTDQECHALSLLNSSITLSDVAIYPSEHTYFSDAQDQSALTLVKCRYVSSVFAYPILSGCDSLLKLDALILENMDFYTSMVKSAPDTTQSSLSISLHFCQFNGIRVSAQEPIVAGPDVQTILIVGSVFKGITDNTNNSPPTESITGVANRTVILHRTSFEDVHGPLGGTVVFGMQAHNLTLFNVHMINCTNAVHFSDAVAFSGASNVTVASSSVEYSTTSSPWPNGSFLYLPNANTNVTISLTRFLSCKASESGGILFSSTDQFVHMNNINATNCTAEANGGCFCLSGTNATILLDSTIFAWCGAGGSGGGIMIGPFYSFTQNCGEYRACEAQMQGGGIAFVSKSEKNVTFSNVSFLENSAGNRNGNDVAVILHDKARSRVKSTSFISCKSNSSTPQLSFLPKGIHKDWTTSKPNYLPIILIGAGLSAAFVVLGAFMIVIQCRRLGLMSRWKQAEKKAKSGRYIPLCVDDQPINRDSPTQPTSDSPQPGPHSEAVEDPLIYSVSFDRYDGLSTSRLSPTE
ncbi:hypothetical protein BLNAU_19786 [Blattamonas nauphoetae]|uniref:Right handed beta helix domain-containing protein n=1 Tax=Blattamonas nauphoetae TaxID=2049346 RepID=A0ABQ9X0Q9_9EUKA|nr:hypothetical protein BLNAU_19786 [Blattamonas nauphoetae]